MKQHLLPAFAALCATCAHAQVLPLFPQHAQHLTLINPAALSVTHQLYEADSDWDTWLAHRNQWANTDGPQYLAARFEWSRTEPPDGFHLAALGGHLLSFQTGPLQRHGVFLRAAFRQNLNKRWRLCIGVSPGAVLYQTDLAQLALLHLDDPVLAALPRTQALATLGTGLFAYHRADGGGQGKSCAWAGLSMPQMLVLPIQRRDTSLAHTGWRGGPLYATAGWHQTVAEGEAFVEPTLWLKTERGLPPLPEASFKAGMEWDGRVSQLWLCAGYAPTARMLHTELGLDWKITADYTARMMMVYDLFGHSYRPAFPAAFEVGVAVFHRK